MAKDAKGHGSDGRGGPAQPIPGHPYHGKTDAELHFIAKDAHAAAQAMQGHNSTAENKYRDQVNDASTVLGYRSRGGAMDIAAQHGIDTSHLSSGLGRGLGVDWSKAPNPHAGGFAGATRARRNSNAQEYVASRATRPSNFKLS